MKTDDLLSLIVTPGVLGGGGELVLPTENLLFMWDADDSAYADTGATTPSTDGGIIRAALDLSGNGHTVPQAGASSICPVWREVVAAFNNHAAFEFDGVDDVLSKTITAILGNLNVYTVYIVWRSDQTGSGEDVMFGEGSTAGNNPRVTAVLNTTTGKIRHFHSDDAVVYTSYSGHAENLNDNTAHLLTIRRIASDSFEARTTTWQECTDTHEPTTTTTNTLSLGAWVTSGAQAHFKGQITLVAAYSADNYVTVEPIIQEKYALCETYFDNVANWYWSVGDSKVIGWNAGDLACGGFGFQPDLDSALTVAAGGSKWRAIRPHGGHGGYKAADIKAVIDADIAAIPAGEVPDYVLISISNDLGALPAEATWKSDMGYIFSAIHTEFPSTEILICKSVRLAANPPSSPIGDVATLHGWIDDLIAAYDYVSEGWDETDLEGGDSYVTNFEDYLHPNDTGYTATANLIKTAMGY